MLENDIKKLLYLVSLLFMLLVSCTQIKDPEFRRLEKFGVKNFAISEVGIGFQVTYFNPNNFGVTVKEAVGDVYIDSVYVGKFVQGESVEVSKNEEFSIPLNGRVALSDILKLKTNELNNRLLLISARGTVKVGKAGVYIKRPFNYSERQKLNLNL